ncbi:MAG: GHKL domain-containing protein [Bacteroidales bacterium]|nr:GHKL domain-containing protein [Bacteroidales bacterium]
MAEKIKNRQLVFTVKDRCRVCYTCVRECPCKAIRIVNGQAEVMDERCIGCGNCVNVCSQEAKIFLNTVDKVKLILKDKTPTIALIAPSFPSEFQEIENYKTFVGMVKQIGFDYVTEVAFGADLVANEYKKVFRSPGQKPVIAANCPTIVAYIERYYPSLVEDLCKIASPMVAMARVVKKKYGEESKVVFIGPCVSKKAESNEVDEVLTFRELRDMFKEMNIRPENATAREFDPPTGRRGAIFPISRGMLQTVKIYESLFDGNIIVAEGKPSFMEAIKEFYEGYIKNQHLELLACQGCIMGPGMSKNGQRFSRRKAVSDYVLKKLEDKDKEVFVENLTEYGKLDLSQTYDKFDQTLNTPSAKAIEEELIKMGKVTPSDYLDCGACGYPTCWDHAVAIVNGLAENEMCLPFTIEKLHKYNDRLVESNEKLANMQKALKQKEKLAGMGQLSAGIAHELNNPLGVVIMYSNLLLEECPDDSQMRKDLELIVEQANRCKKIVGGLLSFSRKDQVRHTATNALDLMRKSVSSVVVPENITVTISSELNDPIVMLDEDQMIQVFSNLIKNAIEAMPDGGLIDILIAEKLNNIFFEVKDTGKGIEQEYLDKVFEPFFTTKETGKGTGLGLPTIYGIIKMHKGSIQVKSQTDETKGPTGTTFEITIPRILHDNIKTVTPEQP